MDSSPQVRPKRRGRAPLQDATNKESVENSPVVGTKRKISDTPNSGRKRNKKSLTPDKDQTFLTSFFKSKPFNKSLSEARENSSPRFTSITIDEPHREDSPSTSHASTENDDDVVCLDKVKGSKKGRSAKKTITTFSKKSVKPVGSFLSEDEGTQAVPGHNDTLTEEPEEIPPQYIDPNQVDALVRFMKEEDAHVAIKPNHKIHLEDLNLRKCMNVVYRVELEELRVQHVVQDEYDASWGDLSDQEPIPDDGSEILDDYPDQDNGLDGCYDEVDKILAVKLHNDEEHFLLKWTGYPYTQNSWVTLENMVSSLTDEFQKRMSIRRKVAWKLDTNDRKAISKRWKENKDFLEVSSVKFLSGLEKANSYFKVHEWEDEMNQKLTGSSHCVLYIENWIDSWHKPRDFTFITTNKITPEVQAMLDESQRIFEETKKGHGLPNYGCKCTESECGSKKHCCPDRFDVHFRYTPKGKLRKDFDPLEQIVECWEHCACSTACPTRLVQRGRQIPVMLFRTATRGWGVRACQKIEALSFVMEYVGEVITLEEAEKRVPTYIFDLDGCGSKHKAFSIDASRFGNEARFINHSCDPNLIVMSVYLEHLDQRFHRLALFARRDIDVGEELTFNYFSNIAEETLKEKAKRLRSKTSQKRCQCGAANCRKFFG